MSSGRPKGVIEVSGKDSENPASSKKRGPGSNGELCSYALKGVEKDSDDELEEGEIEEGEVEAPSHPAPQGARKGVVDLSLGGAHNEIVGRPPAPIQPSPSGAAKAAADDGEQWFGKSKLEHLVRLAEPEDATASEEPAAKKAKAQADNDSKPSPTRAGNGKARLSTGGEDGGDDMEIDNEGTSTHARRASTSSLPPAPKEVKSASQMSSFAKRLLEKRTGPAPVEPPPEIIPMDDYILQGFKEEYVQRAPTEGSDSESDVEVADGLKPIGLLGGRARGSDDVKDGDEERAAEEDPADPAANRIVRMTNIPFTTTEQTLRELFERFGEVEEVQMIMDRETNRFRGICVATYKVLKCATSAVRTLHERLLEGRKVFVDYQTDRRRSFNNRPDNRYFLIDTNIKCRRCGGEGHTLKLCPEAQKIKPCHICGALNAHDPNMCPDRVDALEEEFNVCLDCGGIDHPTRSCPHVANGVDTLETGCVRCIRCAQYGHVNCGADDKVWRPGSRSADYCYKCGGNTHLAQRCSLAFAEQDDGSLRRNTTGGGTHIRYNDEQPSIEQDRYHPDNGYNQSYPRQQEYQHQQLGAPPPSYPPPPPSAPAHVPPHSFDPPYGHGGNYEGGAQYYPPPPLPPGGPPPPAYPPPPPVSNAYPPYSPSNQYPGPGHHFGNGGPPPPPMPQQHYPPQPQGYNHGPPGHHQHDYHDGGYRRHSSGF